MRNSNLAAMLSRCVRLVSSSKHTSPCAVHNKAWSSESATAAVNVASMRAPRRQFRPGNVLGVGLSEKVVELVSKLRRLRSQHLPSNVLDVQGTSLSGKPWYDGKEWFEMYEAISYPW